MQRENRKNEFFRNSILDNIRSGTVKTNKILSAKNFIKKLKYDMVLQTEAQKAKINDAIYLMEVQKKFNFDMLKEIIDDRNTRKIHDSKQIEKQFHST